MKVEVGSGLAILLLLSLGFYASVPIAHADASHVLLSAFTPTPPTLDGSIGTSGWSSAATLNFTVTNYWSYSTNGTIYEMNDNQNLYIGLKIVDSTLDGRAVFIYFDNNHTGTIGVGDDLITYQLGGTNMDGFISHIVGGAGYSDDTDAGGTTDGQTKAVNYGGYNYFAFSHPLCSGDRLDFCLSVGQTVGFDVGYGGPYGGGEWPQNLIGTDGLDASGYGDIVIQSGSPFLSVAPSSGSVGTPVAMTGFGFVASHAVTATYGSLVTCPSVSGGFSCFVVYHSVTPLALSGSCTTSSTGSLGGCTFTVPSVPGSLSSQHVVTVTDGSNNLTATFTVFLPTISLYPSSGAVGTSVTITGSGFNVLNGLRVAYDNSTAGMPTTCASAASGNVSSGCMFTVPSSALGNRTITVGDDTNRPTANFTVTLLGVKCSKSTVVVGSRITCSATVHESGTFAPTGYVTWSSSSPGTFSSSFCALSRHKSYSVCSVGFTPTAADSSVILTVNYRGDLMNPPTAGTYNLAVTMKATRMMVSCTPKSGVAGSRAIISCKAVVKGYLPSGRVAWSQSGTGSVFILSLTNQCALTKGTCSIAMTGLTTGSVALTASYSGDSNNQASSQMARLTIWSY